MPSKIKAFLAHLAISITFVSVIIGSIIYFWYPLDYIGITGFKDIALLILLIDLVLGPVLTFVIFNPAKKNLRFDLTIIATIQLSGLIYGAYILFQGHPVYLTYSKGSFTLVNAKLAEPKNATFDEYKISKFETAKVAFAELPRDPVKRSNLLVNSMSGNADLNERVDLYQPYKNHIQDILDETLNASAIFSDEHNKNKTEHFLIKYGQDINKFAYLPLEGATKDIIIVLDRKSAKPLATIDIDPWQYTKK